MNTPADNRPSLPRIPTWVFGLLTFTLLAVALNLLARMSHRRVGYQKGTEVLARPVTEAADRDVDRGRHVGTGGATDRTASSTGSAGRLPSTDVALGALTRLLFD